MEGTIEKARMPLYLLNKNILQTLDEVGKLSKHPQIKVTNSTHGTITNNVARNGEEGSGSKM